MLQRAKRFVKASRADKTFFRFTLLRYATKLIMPEFRLSWPHMDWWENEDFNQFLAKFNELNEMNNERKWILSELMRLTFDVPLDTAECGVFRGASSYLIAKMNQVYDSESRIHHIFDSFEGLSSPSNIDGATWEKGSLSCELGLVKSNLKGLSNIEYYKGWIPDRFSAVESKTFSFVHIDVDLFEPTHDSMKFFYERMNPGGIIVCDDYGFSSCPGATKAIDEILKDKMEKMIALPTGGGFMIKGKAVGVGYSS